MDPFLSSSFDSSSSPSIDSTHHAISDEEAYATVATSGPKRRAGRKKFHETRHPVYRGVRQRNRGKWVCEVREPNKKSRIWLGTFPTPEMAARAHDVAAMALRGRKACLNFADSAWLLPVPVSSSTKDIQKAAAEAAKAFWSPESDESSTEADVKEEKIGKVSMPEDVFFMDEEAIFGMPRLLERMAEAMLIPPPPCIGSGLRWDDVETDTDVSLWSYSI